MISSPIGAGTSARVESSRCAFTGVAAMASVVFLRGVNVGGKRAFRPAVFARELEGLEVVNLGAAGTFVVRSAAPQSTIRREIERRLPFEAEILICRAGEIERLVTEGAFPSGTGGAGARRFASVLARRPRTVPRLPLRRPIGGSWQVDVVAMHGRFALSLWRRGDGSMLYPNEVVEKEFGQAATTRTWDTMHKLYDLVAKAG